MKPVFPRINKAISFTLDYFTEGQIIEYMEAYTRKANGLTPTSYKFSHWEELLFNLHNQMEKEILQTVYTCNKNTQVIMFEELREWVNNDWRISKDFNGGYFWKVVTEHNDRVNIELEEKLEMEVSKHQNTNEYKTLSHNEEYEREVFPSPLSISNLKSGISYKEKVLFRKYYCNSLPANFLDYYQVVEYKNHVNKIVGNFRSIIEKHLALFDAGKYVTLQEIAHQKEQFLISPPHEKLLLDSPQTSVKLKFNISVPQLVVLFKTLKERGLIEKYSDAELIRFIQANISSKSANEISEKSLQNSFSSLEKTAIDYWLEEIKQLRITLSNLNR